MKNEDKFKVGNMLMAGDPNGDELGEFAYIIIDHGTDSTPKFEPLSVSARATIKVFVWSVDPSYKRVSSFETWYVLDCLHDVLLYPSTEGSE